jgi:hypothetical protein
VVGDTTLKRVPLASGKGALGTWRSQVGQRRESEEPAFSDEPEGKREMSGVYASQRLRFLMFRQTCRGKPGSERSAGNPTGADRRGACGTVDDGGTRHPPRLSQERVMVTLCLKSRAPQFYLDPGYPAHAIPSGSTVPTLLKDRIRLWKAGVRDLVMELCCALHNFRVRLTPWLPMV